MSEIKILSAKKYKLVKDKFIRKDCQKINFKIKRIFSIYKKLTYLIFTNKNLIKVFGNWVFNFCYIKKVI